MDTLDRTAGAIRGRAARVVHIINAEMENYEPGVYTERVLESIKLLSETGRKRSQTHLSPELILCSQMHELMVEMGTDGQRRLGSSWKKEVRGERVRQMRKDGETGDTTCSLLWHSSFAHSFFICFPPTPPPFTV